MRLKEILLNEADQGDVTVNIKNLKVATIAFKNEISTLIKALGKTYNTTPISSFLDQKAVIGVYLANDAFEKIIAWYETNKDDSTMRDEIKEAAALIKSAKESMSKINGKMPFPVFVKVFVKFYKPLLAIKM